MKLLTITIIASAALTTSAFAADLTAPQPEPVAPAPVAMPTSWSFGIEASPEFFAINQDPHDSVPPKQSKKPANGIADYYIKPSLSYSFGGGWFVTGSFQAQVNKNRDTANNFVKDTWRYYSEADLGYKFKFGAFTIAPSGGIGYTWGFTGVNGSISTSKDNDAVYWAAYLAGDYKINSQWTWNVFNVRWRQAFNYNWITPKAATGVTYNLTAVDSVYVSGGYSWKETDKSGQATSAPFNPQYGSLDSDKWNVAIGYKRAF